MPNRHQRKVERLQRHIEETEKLLDNWESKRRAAENPAEIQRCNNEIQRLEELLEDYETKLENVHMGKPEGESRPEKASGGNQNTASGIQTGNISAGGDVLIGGTKSNEQSTTGEGNFNFQDISGSTININMGKAVSGKSEKSSDSNTPKQEAQNLHVAGNYKKALERMIVYFEEQDETEEANILRINLGSLNRTEKQHSMGVLSQADYNLQMSRVAQAIVRGIEEMKE